MLTISLCLPFTVCSSCVLSVYRISRMWTQKKQTIEFLKKAYSVEKLKAQAGVQQRYAGTLGLSTTARKTMMADLPVGKASAPAYKEKLATSLFESDRKYPSKTDEEVQKCRTRAELELEARRRRVDISPLGSTLAKLRDEILKSPVKPPAKADRTTKTTTSRAKRTKSGPEAGPESEAEAEVPAAEWQAHGIVKSRRFGDETEYLVHWRPCKANKYNKEEKTWEAGDCEYIKGGMARYIDRYLADLHESGENKQRKLEQKKRDEDKEAQKKKAGTDEADPADEDDKEDGADEEQEEEEEKAPPAKKKRVLKTAAVGKKRKTMQGRKKQGSTKACKKQKRAEQQRQLAEEEPNEDPEEDVIEVSEEERDEEEEIEEAASNEDLAAAIQGLAATSQAMLQRQDTFSEKVSTAIAALAVKRSGAAADGADGKGSEKRAVDFWELWEEKGHEKFKRYVGAQKWYKKEKVEHDSSEEVRRMNGFIERKEYTEDETMDAMDAAELDEENAVLEASSAFDSLY